MCRSVEWKVSPTLSKNNAENHTKFASTLLGMEPFSIRIIVIALLAQCQHENCVEWNSKRMERTLITISVFHNEFYLIKFPVSINFAMRKMYVCATHIFPFILLVRIVYWFAFRSWYISLLSKRRLAYFPMGCRLFIRHVILHKGLNMYSVLEKFPAFFNYI